VHPESGRKGLFVNPGFTSHVVGVSDAESRAILDLLYAHLTKPEHTIRHRWRAGDVGIWDNRSTSHYANRDYTEVRTMRRITLAGDRPVGPAGGRPGLTHLGDDQGFPGRSRHLGPTLGPMAQASKRSVLPYLLLVLVGLVGLALPPFALDAAHGLAVAALVAGALGLIVGRRADTDAAEAPAVATHTATPAPAAARERQHQGALRGLAERDRRHGRDRRAG
jgi:hypothetical protein